jgi:hypothetical protein
MFCYRDILTKIDGSSVDYPLRYANPIMLLLSLARDQRSGSCRRPARPR